MKTFAIEVDITVSKTIYVEADNIKEAEKIANEKVRKYPHYYYTKADAYVCHEITDINEDNE